MRAIQRSVLGIDLSPAQIRVVEVQGRATSARALRTGIAPMPKGGFVDDHIADVDAVGMALRRLVEAMGAGAREAVFGLASGRVATQVMGVPHVPDNELPTVLEGELEHYKIVRPGEGAFAYARLSGPASKTTGADAGETQMLLMATEKTVVATYQAVAEKAGVRLLALEPALLAMYRIGSLVIGEQPGALCLSIDRTRSEVAVVEQGTIRLYRRVEVGSDTLFPPTAPSGGAAPSRTPQRASILGEEAEPEAVNPTPSPGLGGNAGGPLAMNMAAARSLALEVRRSLEYYRRENPQGGTITQAVVVSDSTEIEPFLPWLNQELELQVRLARPSEVTALGEMPPPYITEGFEAGRNPLVELNLIPALGLGIGVLPEPRAGVLHFDLSSEETATATIETARRMLSLSLAASIALLLLGAVLTLAVGLHANGVDHELDHLKQELDEKLVRKKTVIDPLLAQQTELAVLQKKGVPFPRLMDAITDIVAPYAGLTEVDLDKVGKLTVVGNAATYPAIVSTLDRMRSISWFEIPSLDSFDRRVATTTTPAFVQFKILAQLTALKPEPPKTGGNP